MHKKSPIFKRAISFALTACMMVTSLAPTFAYAAADPPDIPPDVAAIEQTTSTPESTVEEPGAPDESAAEPEETAQPPEIEETPSPTESPDKEDSGTDVIPEESETPEVTPEPSATPVPEEGGEEATPDSSASPSPNPSATPNPDASPEPSSTPNPEMSPEPSPELSASPEPTDGESEVAPEEDSESQEEFEPIMVLDPKEPIVTAEIGEEVTLTSGINREDVQVEYQWQRFQNPLPKKQVTLSEPIYEYSEGEPTWYRFLLADTTEMELLAENPESTWGGIELFYAAKQALDDIGATYENITFEWKTPNFALDGYTISAAVVDGVTELYAEKEGEKFVARQNEYGEFSFTEEDEVTPVEPTETEWQDIEGATDPSYTFTVEEADYYAKFRLKVTIRDEEYLEQVVEMLENQDVVLTEEQKAKDQILYSIVMQVESTVADEPAEEEPAGLMDVFSDFVQKDISGGPQLSADGQWIENLSGNYEYITEDTYNRVKKWYDADPRNHPKAYLNACWTWLQPEGFNGHSKAPILDSNGCPIVGQTRDYNGFDLTDGHKLEVASEWYGKTVYFRLHGQDGIGTAIKIPAYTGVYNQSGHDDGLVYNDAQSGSRYKKAVTFLNAWVPDVGAVYRDYLRTAATSFDNPNKTSLSFDQGTHITSYDVSAEAFNADPARYMVDAEGNYRMDSVGWGVCVYQEPDLSGKSYWLLKDYIANGYGFLTGHDTMYAYAGSYYDAYGQNLDESTIDPNDGTTWYYDVNSWQPTAHTSNGQQSSTRGGHFYLNELMGSNKGNVYSGNVKPEDAPSLILSTGGSHGPIGKDGIFADNNIRVVMNGFDAATAAKNPRYRTPTNYPYSYTPGENIAATYTHTNGQVAFGPIWVEYAGPSWVLVDEDYGKQQWTPGTKPPADKWRPSTYEQPLQWDIDGKKGTNNFYLTGFGNYLMNQIGHIPKQDTAISETRLFVNSVMYVSQRKQCEICAANQNGQQTSHFVRRVSKANWKEVITALQKGGTYWYPIDGCYQLTEDVTLPDGWTPIKGFKGHWNSDVYKVTLAKNGKPLLENSVADGPNGWNLGTDRLACPAPNVFTPDYVRTTGVARVVGDMRHLFPNDTVKNYAGYRVVVRADENRDIYGPNANFVIESTVNTDSKYVLSNIPCDDTPFVAHVYDPNGKEVTKWGTVVGRVPASYWNTDMTRPLYLLNYSFLPPKDREIWLSQDASFEAAVITNTLYPEKNMIWEYRMPDSKNWIALPRGDHRNASAGVPENGLPFQYRTVNKGYIKTDSPKTSGTYDTLEIINAPVKLNEIQFRLKYFDSQGKPCYTNDVGNGTLRNGAKLIVKSPAVKVDIQKPQQKVWVRFKDKNNNQVKYAVTVDKWLNTYGVNYPEEKKALNNGNNEAVYTSTTIYKPTLDNNKKSPPPDIVWRYRPGIMYEEKEFAICQWNGKNYTWRTLPEFENIKSKFKAPNLKVRFNTTAPVLCDANGKPVTAPPNPKDPADVWQKVVSTMTVTNPSIDMDFGNTHFFFRTESRNKFGFGASAKNINTTSSDVELFVDYLINIEPNLGVRLHPDQCLSGGGADWKFPNLEIVAPNGLRFAIVMFDKNPTGKNEIRVNEAAWKKAGITPVKKDKDYWMFSSSNGKLIAESVWQNLFRKEMQFISYDKTHGHSGTLDENLMRKDITWYIAEEDEASKFELNVFDGTTKGWGFDGQTQYFPGYGWDGWTNSNVGGYAANTYKHGVKSGYLYYDMTTAGKHLTPMDSVNGKHAELYAIRGYNAKMTKEFVATNYSKLIINAQSSSQIHEDGGLKTPYFALSAPQSNFSVAIRNGRNTYDISSVVGKLKLEWSINSPPKYAFGPGSSELNRHEEIPPHTASVKIYEIKALAKNFERSNRTAYGYGDIYGCKGSSSTQGKKLIVSLTPDPNKVYNGEESRAKFEVVQIYDEATHTDITRNERANVEKGLTMEYRVKNGGLTVPPNGEPNPSRNKDMKSGCKHQNTYTCKVTFDNSIRSRYAKQPDGSGGIYVRLPNGKLQDISKQGFISVDFKITPRPVYVHSRYFEPQYPMTDSATGRNVKAYDGNTNAVIYKEFIDPSAGGKKVQNIFIGSVPLSNGKFDPNSGVVVGDELDVNKNSYAGHYATKDANEPVPFRTNNGPHRLKNLTENTIQLNNPKELALENNKYGDYYISGTSFSGAIYRADLDVNAKRYSYMYGSEYKGDRLPGKTPASGDIGLPRPYDNVYKANASKTPDSWISIDGLKGNDILKLSDSNKFAFNSYNPDGSIRKFTSSTPVGNYIVEIRGVTESNYPVLKNYLTTVGSGEVAVTPREIVITPEDIDRSIEQDKEPLETFAHFKMMNDDGETFTEIGNDRDSDYGELHLANGDTVLSTILLDNGQPLVKPAPQEQRANAENETYFKNISAVPFWTKWYQGAPVKYANIQTDAEPHNCDWCEHYYGYDALPPENMHHEKDTAHWTLNGYLLRANQDSNFGVGTTLKVATVKNLNGEDVQNYEIRYEDAQLRVHPKQRFRLEATVPMYVCMYGFAETGDVVTPNEYGIRNYSNGPIQIENIEVSNDGWIVTDKNPQLMSAGEISLRLHGMQLKMGNNHLLNPDGTVAPELNPQPRENWVIARDDTPNHVGIWSRIPIEAQIAGGFKNARKESYVTHITYTVGEYGWTLPEVPGVDLPESINGNPVTIVPDEVSYAH